MRIGFVVQRYGTEILGGSEYHCRLIAERLAGRHEVEVLTTCAQDYVSWKNAYQEGTDRIRGVTVRRFANDRQRNIEAFNRYSDWIFHNTHTPDDEMEWLRQQGPWSPALLEYLEGHHSSYDVLVFFTYLYAPTVLGLAIDPGRSILVPTAHDEPAIYLELYKKVFELPAGIAYNTEVERHFIRSHFRVGAMIEDTIGCGVDLPQAAAPVQRPPRTVRQDPEQDADSDEDEAIPPRAHAGRGVQFKRRHRLHDPFVLYGGRIDPGKGCEELIEYFSTYVSQGGEATLVLMGIKLMPLPEEPFVRFAGLLPERERLEALEAATVVAVPSPFESLSLLALESMAVATPVLVNARSDVLVAHCRQSNAGLYYADRDEFVEALKLLIADERLRGALGRQGREYVRRHYRWDTVLGKYERLFARIKAQPAA